MRSWSRLSAEPEGPPPRTGQPLDPEQAERLRRRAVESLRRAEIFSLLAEAADVSQLGQLLCDELCEVYDAEVAILTEHGPGGDVRELGSTGLGVSPREELLASPDLVAALDGDRATTLGGEDLLQLGGRAGAGACYRADEERHLALTVVRRYPQPFDAAELALLENVMVATGGAVERLWALAERNALIEQLKEAVVGISASLASALEAKDDYTAEHATEVADLAYRVGAHLGLSESELEDLRYGAIFHDIGKIAIPDEILNKRGPLDPDEWEAIEQHPVVGERILEPIGFLSDEVRAMVRHDHERWDGRGYPDGLEGEDIPLGARIILVVDSFHAMTSDRPYREAIGVHDALEELRRHAGTQFDPRVVEAFLEVVG